MVDDKIVVLGMQLNPVVGDIDGNMNTIIEVAYEELRHEKEHGSGRGVVMVLPECFLSGYPPEDLLERDDFMTEIMNANHKIVDAMEIPMRAGHEFTLVYGSPVRAPDGKLFNSAIIIKCEKGKMETSVVHKVSLPNVNVFDERRYFSDNIPPEQFDDMLNVFNFMDTNFVVAICEDIWQPALSSLINTYKDPDTDYDYVLVLNGSPYEERKMAQRIKVADEFRKALDAYALMYVNMYGGQDEVVFDGGSFIIDVSDVYWIKSFGEDCIQSVVTKNNSVHTDLPSMGGVEYLSNPENWDNDVVTRMNYAAIRLGLEDYMYKNGFTTALIGNSGGIDSALALCFAAHAIGPENVISICMPSAFSSQETSDDAEEIAKNLGVKHLSVPINSPVAERDQLVENVLFMLDHNPSDVSLQNSQARERGMILMQLSNSIHNAMVVSTGNRSEMSAGYATLYGDMCGGFNPNKDLYKHQVYALARYVNDTYGNPIPQQIIDKEPTAELAHDQKDSDSLPPYDILDYALECLVDNEMSIDDTTNAVKEKCRTLLYGQQRYEIRAMISDIANRVFGMTEYKRRQSPPGVKIRAENFGRGRRYPITNKFRG